MEQATTIRKYRNSIKKLSDDGQSVYGMLVDTGRMTSNFAIGGGALFFLYAISKRQSWLPYTIAGLVLGSGLGWMISEVKKELEEIKEG